MAAIAKKTTGIRPIDLSGDFEQEESRLGETLVAGDVVRLDATTGEFTGSNASSATEGNFVGILLTGGIAGEYATAITAGKVEGFDLSALSFGDPVYLANTDKGLDTAVGTGTYIVGRVYPGRASGATLDKLLKVRA